MESTGILAIDREQQLTAALATFGNSGQLNFFTASSQFNGSVPSNGFDQAHLTAIAIEQQQIADFIVPETSEILSYSANNQLASGTSHAPQTSNSDDRAIGTDPLTGTTTASQLNLSYPDNTLATARNVVGVENGRINLSDFVGVGDRDDYYRFTVNSNSDLSLRLDGLSANAGIELIQDKNRNGRTDYDEFLDWDYAGTGTSGEINFLCLTPGTYYVGVYNYVGSTNYNLTFSATPGNGFSSNYGYGLLDANAAVSRTLNRPNMFPQVSNLGENDWGRDTINAPEVWNQGISGKGIVVAVVDSGVDYTHPDLDDNIWQNAGEIPDNGIDDDRNGYIDDIRGWDFVYQDNNPMDFDGHGTHVAGAIAAERNDFGITGVAYNAKIMPVRVLDANVEGYPDEIAAGIRYAADNGANVINLSLGGWYPSPLEDEAIGYATDKGVVVVIAAGNEGFTEPDYPAINADRLGIAVGAIDVNDRMDEYSNRAGSKVLDYVVAPGIDIYSTTPDDSYEIKSGTSMATPHVAGVAALVLNANPTLTPAQVGYILTTTANPNAITV
ncbi:MAG: S8 family serine peptidase [Microcoleus sp. PH2017_10_PVI_O_A]|uniref:S8 family serine peptidase n=1 Tax=unclassified Microcoleus TaxID=2642155 RepID=UPI001DF35FA6|nr:MULTISPECIES: S8 family serine peptidase [unclassified Microcoleus]TAE82880.1 MAG: peptidase S8 [Oscillatoriales cyanobacterium]MCC3406096.1 S8 family serine peptidase [Microcoleus sp. PH2017_10_PVI_O_A]MCC3462382.1 S8 family serine peptidase [Microcoleus sp. PH2017_11_PCY_U_A]MCC3478997.1 S8 family serine peptidase [Microcoleus sp. PH2017_12_PCY_D_A]MCC3529392.1 S8 family serine peptidase [Microcoleus sp. PH2017_21_RUC_O_A]